jgi:radical SAM protein with 4Fe4S-binding SPASM domain
METTLSFSLLSAAPDTPTLEQLIPTERDLIEIACHLMQAGINQAVSFVDMPVSTSLSVKSCCGAGRNCISVAYDGRVYPCHMLHYDQFCLGSIFESDIEDILNDEVRSKFISLNVERFSQCSDCELKYLCGGGCRARAFLSLGSIFDKDSYCALIKVFNEQYFKVLLSKE